MALATAGALAIVVSLAFALTRAAPARDVFFVGGKDGDDARCHGPVVWTGEVAWTACDWFYRDRALVELDPETARATVLHQWSVDDGNTPGLRIVRPCEGGQLFVIGEGRRTTVVTRRAAEVRASVADFPGDAVLGATCSGGGVDLFVAEADGYSIYRAEGEVIERRRTIRTDAVAGQIVGAWFEGDAWHVVVNNTRDHEVLFGRLESGLSRIDGAGLELSLCLIGEPGGWLGPGRGSPCSLGAAVHREHGALRITRLEQRIAALVVDESAKPGFGMTIEGPDTKLFRGPGALDLELRRRGPVYEAQRGSGDPVVVAKASFSALDVGVRALPLSGERVAIWGDLGGRLVILGPDLRRLDELGILERTLRPFGRFQASSKSLFDQGCYFTLLLASLAWLVALAISWRQKQRPRRLVSAAGLFVALFGVGVWGFFNVLAWI